MSKQHDNTTLPLKIALRSQVMQAAGPGARVLETHGGFGRIFERVWHRASTGVVFELDASKCQALAEQRPRWDVYEADALTALRFGYGRWRPFDIVDLDPYGGCIDFLPVLFDPQRPRPSPWWLTVNCGLRQSLKLGRGWRSTSLARYLPIFGNQGLYAHYLAVLHRMVADLAAEAGERVTWSRGYYCGHSSSMTHAAWRLERTPAPGGDGAASGNGAGAGRKRPGKRRAPPGQG